MSLQERSYPDLKVPIVLPFLADGILALGGMSAEGIFRVPGDNDSIFELKSRIDRGHYQLVSRWSELTTLGSHDAYALNLNDRTGSAIPT